MVKGKQATMVKVWKQLTPEQKQTLCKVMDCQIGALALMRLTKVFTRTGDISGCATIHFILWKAIKLKVKSQRIR